MSGSMTGIMTRREKVKGLSVETSQSTPLIHSSFSAYLLSLIQGGDSVLHLSVFSSVVFYSLFVFSFLLPSALQTVGGDTATCLCLSAYTHTLS